MKKFNKFWVSYSTVDLIIVSMVCYLTKGDTVIPPVDDTIGVGIFQGGDVQVKFYSCAIISHIIIGIEIGIFHIVCYIDALLIQKASRKQFRYQRPQV